MKIETLTKNGVRRILNGAFTFLIVFVGTKVVAEPADNVSTNSCIESEVITQIETINSNKPHGDMVKLFQDASTHRQKTIQTLLAIFNDPKSYVFPKCCVAHYLGELRASEAADSLAAQITLMAPLGHHSLFNEDEPAKTALIRIGIPSIPAVIRNLAASDDARVREFSLYVLQQIDGDKDIVQLRLQKALKAETDSQKQARLQAALKSLVNVQ